MLTSEERGYFLGELLDEIEVQLAEALPDDPFLKVMSDGLAELRATIEAGNVTEAQVDHWRGVRDMLEEYRNEEVGLSLLAEALKRKE